MKTVSKFLIALIVIVAISTTGCRNTKKEHDQHDHSHDEHGHSHDEGSGHSHEHEEVKQEEFTVGKDSVKTGEKTHTHDNGETHHDH